MSRHDPALQEAFEANRAAIDAAFHYDRNSFVRRSLFDFAVKFHDADPVKIVLPVADNAKMEFAKRVVGNCLNDEQKVRLAIFVLDGVDGIGEDDRFALNSILGETLSGLRL